MAKKVVNVNQMIGRPYQQAPRLRGQLRCREDAENLFEMLRKNLARAKAHGQSLTLSIKCPDELTATYWKELLHVRLGKECEVLPLIGTDGGKEVILKMKAAEIKELHNTWPRQQGGGVLVLAQTARKRANAVRVGGKRMKAPKAVK